MSRKITDAAVSAFNRSKEFISGNTTVSYKAMRRDGQFPKGDHWVVMELFGNEIACKDSGTSEVFISNAGWVSKTTNEILNGLGAGVSTSKGKMLRNGLEMPNNIWVSIREETKVEGNRFSSVAMVAMMGDIFSSNIKESNDWKARMIKAGMPSGAIDMPSDWDSLPEEEKQRRLDGVIEVMKG